MIAAESPTGAGYVEPGRLRTSILIGLLCLLIYNVNGRAITAGDTYPARYLPFAIVKFQTVFLDPVAEVTAQGRGTGAFWMLHGPDGHFISLYPIVTPLLVAPLYVPAASYLTLTGWTNARLDHLARIMEKLSASLIASLSASLLYLLLRRRARRSIALLLTVAYAFGTTTWTISSQALWQHGMGALLVIGALLFLTRESTVPRAIATGLLLGLIAANRPPDLILAAALGIYGLFWAGGRRHAAWLVAASALPLATMALYNFGVAGNVLGGYGLIGNARFFSHQLLPGVAGLLFSPTRGLLIFSPFLLFLVLAGRSFPRSRQDRLLTVTMLAAVVIQILLYAKADWRGGLSWGPRYMTDLLPFLLWMLVPVVSALRGAARIAFLVATSVSILIQAIGAFCYSPSYDLPIFAADRGAEYHDMRGAWQWRNASLLTSLRNGIAPPDFTTGIRGTFDAIEAEGRQTSVVTAGQKAFATGWTLAGSKTPWQVAIMIEGQPPASTRTFFDRPDVRAALDESSPSGWRIPIDTTGLPAGEHSVTAFVWTSEKGQEYYLQERKLTVQDALAEDAGTLLTRGTSPDLEESARTAVRRIKEHHEERGYWLTAYTSGTSFRDPRPEMNTFLTAFLVDLLDPVAAWSGLGDDLQRARRHLTAQIEAGGLVRYHGRPDGPGIGTLGCAITPDTDDTALVWRIAPGPQREQLMAALATIDQYRTAEGLYRTWLAPREAYQCLDPGHDPNPADIGIQMHLLLLLSEVRPEAASELCDDLRPLTDEDRLWVYYRKAPLTPILRVPDVKRAGCELELPESRMQTTVADQQIWTTVARLVAAPSTPQGASPDRARIRAVMRELARQDFALIRTNPPLFYHNDLTATVPRYYWSEDLGYALWLRLYDRYERDV